MYYRVVDELIEQPEKEYDSITITKGMARKNRARELYPLFDCIGEFSEKKDVKLDVAMNIATYPEIYIPQLKNALGSGQKNISFGDIGCFMIDKDIEIKELISYMKIYQNLCDEKKTWITEKEADRECIWEYIWEKERLRINNNLPSRFQSVSMFEDEFTADQYREDYYGEFGSVLETEIKEQRAFGKYDMSWFTDVPAGVSYREAAMYARNYWHEKENDEPQWECLLDGKYLMHALPEDEMLELPEGEI